MYGCKQKSCPTWVLSCSSSTWTTFLLRTLLLSSGHCILQTATLSIWFGIQTICLKICSPLDLFVFRYKYIRLTTSQAGSRHCPALTAEWGSFGTHHYFHLFHFYNFLWGPFGTHSFLYQFHFYNFSMGAFWYALIFLLCTSCDHYTLAPRCYIHLRWHFLQDMPHENILTHLMSEDKEACTGDQLPGGVQQKRHSAHRRLDDPQALDIGSCLQSIATQTPGFDIVDIFEYRADFWSNSC